MTAGVVVYGNAATLVFADDAFPGRLVANLALLIVAAALVLRLGLGARALGIAPASPLRGWRWGLALGLTVGLGFAAIALVFAAVTGEPIEYGTTADRSALELAVRVAVVFPLQTALPEELVFRGALFAVWARAASPAQSVLATAVAFGLWHAVVAWQTTGDLAVGDVLALRLATYALFLAALAAAGFAFGALRWASGGIAAPALAHWLAVAPVRVAIWFAA